MAAALRAARICPHRHRGALRQINDPIPECRRVAWQCAQGLSLSSLRDVAVGCRESRAFVIMI
jgi:hypothetical protein